MTNRHTYSLDRRIGKLAERIIESTGNNPIIFLDTCAIIDFDKEIRRARLFDKDITTIMFYDKLNLALNLPIYVTEHIYKEADQHTRHKISRFSEISRGTFRTIGNMHLKYCDFLKNVVGNAFEFDKVRYDVYWAGKMAFEETHKKICRDPISMIDRELLATALWAKYISTSYEGPCGSKSISDSIIISSDGHIIQTSKTLMSLEFGYKGLKVVSSR